MSAPDEAGAPPAADDAARRPERRAGRGRGVRGFVFPRSLIAELRERRRMLDRMALALAVLAVLGLGIAWWVITDPDLTGVSAVLVPLVVVAGLRFLDVMIGVFRTSFIVGGRRIPAAIAAATEAAVWLSATGIVLAEMTPARIGAFAVGVGGGTIAGMALVRALRLGMVTVRLFTPAVKGPLVAEALRVTGHGATVFTGEGRDGPVAMVMSVMRRKEARQVCAEFCDQPDVFVTVDSEPGPGAVISGRPGRRL